MAENPPEDPENEAPPEAEDEVVVEAEAEPTPPAGRVYTVFGPRGGSGKTMLAVNLAVALAKAHPNQVCLVDLELTFGHCAMTLNAPPRPSLAAMNVDSIPRMNDASIDRYLSECVGMFKLLVGSNSPEEGDAVTPAHVSSVLAALKTMYPVIIVDGSSAFTEPTIAALESSDKILMVSTLELATLRDVGVSRRILTELIKVPLDRFYWVMNNPHPFKVLAMEQFVENLEQGMDVEIPFGNDIPAKAATAGTPLAISQPGSPVTRAIGQIVKVIEAEAFPQQSQERRGLFGRK